MASVLNTARCFYKIVKNRELLCNYIDDEKNANEAMMAHLKGRTPLLSGSIVNHSILNGKYPGSETIGTRQFSGPPGSGGGACENGDCSPCPPGFQSDVPQDIMSAFSGVESSCNKPIWNRKWNISFIPSNKSYTSGSCIIHQFAYIDATKPGYHVLELSIGTYIYDKTTYTITINTKTPDGRTCNINHTYKNSKLITAILKDNSDVKNINNTRSLLSDTWDDIKKDTEKTITWAKKNLDTLDLTGIVVDGVEDGSILNDVITVGISEIGTEIGGPLGNLIVKSSSDLSKILLLSTGVGIVGEIADVAIEAAGADEVLGSAIIDSSTVEPVDVIKYLDGFDIA